MAFMLGFAQDTHIVEEAGNCRNTIEPNEKNESFLINTNTFSVSIQDQICW